MIDWNNFWGGWAFDDVLWRCRANEEKLVQVRNWEGKFIHIFHSSLNINYLLHTFLFNVSCVGVCPSFCVPRESRIDGYRRENKENVFPYLLVVCLKPKIILISVEKKIIFSHSRSIHIAFSIRWSENYHFSILPFFLLFILTASVQTPLFLYAEVENYSI